MASFTKVLLGIGIFSTAMSLADEPSKADPQPLREFHGTTTEGVTGPIPDELIKEQEAYQAAWRKLGLKESPGEVDFTQEALFLATTRGSRINLRLRDEGEGKLRVMAMATRDIRPGLRYVFGVFSKKDWKQINETLLP
ncbi:MAG: hypothetical protein ACKODZ_06045 [Verrucomicrobiota bacterium]